MTNPITQTITMTVVPNSKRPAFLPEKTGAAYLAFETALYGMADNLSRDYESGYWEFCELSNGGFYCYPATEKDFGCDSLNGFECRMSADAFGITATLFALNCAMDGQSGGLKQPVKIRPLRRTNPPCQTERLQRPNRYCVCSDTSSDTHRLSQTYSCAA